jgi:hypothetical protein
LYAEAERTGSNLRGLAVFSQRKEAEVQHFALVTDPKSGLARSLLWPSAGESIDPRAAGADGSLSQPEDSQ